jgi:hypothetical protein
MKSSESSPPARRSSIAYLGDNARREEDKSSRSAYDVGTSVARHGLPSLSILLVGKLWVASVSPLIEVSRLISGWPDWLSILVASWPSYGIVSIAVDRGAATSLSRAAGGASVVPQVRESTA